jgi:hypothetical protein
MHYAIQTQTVAGRTERQILGFRSAADRACYALACIERPHITLTRARASDHRAEIKTLKAIGRDGVDHAAEVVLWSATI